MSTSGANLRVRVSADLADIKQGLAVLRGDMAKLKREGERSAPDTARWKASLGSIRTQLAGILSVYAALRAVRWYTDQADQAANLTARLRLATKSQKEFETAYKATFQIAQQSSASWESIVGLYATLAQTTGMTQQSVLDLSTALAQAFAVSSASPADTARGLVQIQQALAGGTLRAQEFQSIMETAPRIVQALADHFGIAFGEVRGYVNAGKISSKEFAEAMLNASAAIQADFDKLPVTVGRAIVQVRNSLLALVADTDSASGASSGLAEAIQGLASALSDPDFRAGFAELVTGATNAATAFTMLAGKISGAMRSAQEWLNFQVGGNRKMGGENLAEQRRELKKIEDELAAIRASDEYNQKIEEGRGRIRYLENRRASVSRVIDMNERWFGDPSKPNVTLIDNGQALPESVLAAKASKGTPKPVVTDPERVTATQKKVEQLAESTTLARDEIERALRAIGQAFDDGAMSAADYYAQRTALQEQAIDLQLQELRSELALAESASRRRDIEERIAILERDRAQVAIDNARAQIKAQDELNRKNGEAFGTRLSSITGNLAAREGSISAQVDAGMMGAGEGERQLNALRSEALDKLRDLRIEQQGYVDALAKTAPGSPEHEAALQGLADTMREQARVAESMQKWKGQVEDIGAGALGGFFNDLIDGAKSFSDAFKDMVRNFAQGISQMIAKELALQAVRAMGRAFGAAHGGGVAGSLRMFRNGIDPGVFAMAPRYHGGGVAGLMSNEVPAILQRGEVIRTRQQETALAAQLDAARNGGNAAAPIRNIIVFSEDELASAMSGAAGEKVVVNHARNNRRALDE